MEKDSMQTYPEDEIDLYELWLVLKKRAVAVVVIVLLCLGIGLAYALFSPPVYRVSNIMFLKSFDISNHATVLGMQSPSKVYLVSVAEVKSFVDSLNRFPASQRAGLLGLDAGVMRDIRNIKVSGIKGAEALKIDVDTLDGKSGVKAIDAVVNYINTRPVVRQRIASERAVVLKNTDVLKKIMDKPQVIDGKDRLIMYSPEVSLFTLKESYNAMCSAFEELGKGRVVALGDRTIVPVRPERPKKKLVVAISIVLGLLAGIFVAFSMEWIENARAYHKASN